MDTLVAIISDSHILYLMNIAVTIDTDLTNMSAIMDTCHLVSLQL